MKSLLRHLRGCHSDLAKPSIFLEPDYPRLHLFVAAIRLLPFRYCGHNPFSTPSLLASESLSLIGF
uniref:Uncharacterized protein n=1 Tax=Kalanchoe fedtschenkoi TaxID=63787 RepID=A0A7N0U2C1_KALFE